MRQLFITKGTVDYAYKTAGDIAGYNELNLLADGALACLLSDGTLVDDTLPNVTTSEIYFALGRTSNGPLVTPLIDIASMAYKKTAYTAPAAQIMVIGSTTDQGTTYNLNLSTPVVGTTASITIIDETKTFDNRTREKEYQYVVKTGDTVALIAAGIIAKINADATGIVTAAMVDTTNSDGFKLTADTAGNKFNVTCGGILANADVLGYNEIVFAGTAGITAGPTTSLAVVAANNIGQGTPAQIAELEADFSTEMGNTGLQDRGVSLYTTASRVVAGATYVQYNITWTKPDNNPILPKLPVVQQLVIAVPSGDIGAGKHIAALDSILASL